MLLEKRRLPFGKENGANDWTRTSDPRFTKALLYQLSYIGPKAGSV